ncbi:MAG: zf-HC2 domain-containing protein [Labilithrix sp.]|nr:zf-HC2 domain-containing protein [Labilithrix sp.]MCW5811991.1 zf-HC2 domain-containing protein [Labilithrix sp.]
MSGAVTTSERAMKIMAYADGELEGAERAEVERWMREDAEAVLFANDLAELGDFVQTGHRASKDAKAIAAFDVADAVMAKVEAEPIEKAAESAGKVVPIGAARAKQAKASSKRGAAMWIAAGLALAASIFLVTRGKEEAPMARTTTPLVQPSPQNAAAANVTVENPGQSVSVFYLPNETNSVTTSVVVWVDESGAK